MSINAVYTMMKKYKEVKMRVFEFPNLKVSQDFVNTVKNNQIIVADETHSDGSPAEHVYAELSKKHQIPADSIQLLHSKNSDIPSGPSQNSLRLNISQIEEAIENSIKKILN